MLLPKISFIDRSLLAVWSNLGWFWVQPIKLKWAFYRQGPEDTAIHYDVFVDNLDSSYDDHSLLAAFSEVCGECCGARVIFKPETGRSTGLGYVSFR
jgi:hypothetical protein